MRIMEFWGENVVETRTISKLIEAGKRTKFERIWELYLEGRSYREIAKEVYGDDSKENIRRVSSALYKMRKKYGKPPRLLDTVPQVVPEREAAYLFEEKDALKRKLSLDNRFARQLVEHEQLLYYVIKELGYDARSELFALVRAYHHRLFPRAWMRWGERLKCWRNSRSKSRLFSFTFYSLAYVAALVRSVLVIANSGGDLDSVLRKLLPRRKQAEVLLFLEIYTEIGGWVLASILHPQL